MESSIEYLEADNYSSWRTNMKVLLMERNCWRIVTGTETKPEDKNYKELRDFNSRKDKAYSTIYLNVSKAYRCVIDDIEDPNQSTGCIYAARIRSIVDQLKDAGKPINEWYQAFQLIRFLPPEFNGIVQYIYRWNDKEFKFDKILQELIAEESRLKQSIKDQNETCAFQSIERNISKTPRSNSKPSSYKKNIQPTRKNTKVIKSPNTFIAESNLSQDYERDAWILDTAATSHFCSKKSLLRNFRPVKNLTMSVAVDGVRCDIKGIGTVRMIFENNGELETVDLLNVLYSPRLRRNLISGSLIDQAGSTFSCKKGQINVYSKDGHKLFTAKKLNGLFCVNPRIEVNRNSNDDLGIKAERTNVYSPQQNGVAERYNYTAVDAIKVMLNSSGLSKGFWAEALLCHTYVWNRVCHGNQSLTPFELYSGHKPSVKHLKAFGSTAYAGVPKQLRKKFDMRAKKGIMVGYALKIRGYRIWLPNERKIVETINVSFDEDNMLEPNSSGAVLDPNKKTINVSSNSEFDTESEEESEHLSIPRTPKSQSSEQEGASNNSKTSEKVIWERKTVPRKDRSRTDIYYYIQGSKDRFHCYKDIEEYSKTHNLEYDKALFNFSGKDKYSGIVTMEEANQSD
ncbi:Retrovirus-related Pol polyprotein from transposon TNT 1-94 [Araneus ventricosus]|uniref:Retrovirus-related Pol polyprotein from transposon TNT 1-94 n=1 Tax=Araneus ventricosus TaxID=182803 RepID=A0A4Y2J0I5_ARAVE|nr:Retrovirus-related Pol polyprotein from transposon TNT 1-94 [Araneus ventricosus]